MQRQFIGLENLRCGGRPFSGAVRHLLRLQADRHEQVPQALQRLLVEEIRCEIERETRGIFAELSQQGGLIQAGDQRDQLFNLRLRHSSTFRVPRWICP
jgi:hypothetical protein